MLRNILRALNTTIGGGAVLIAFFSIISKFLGLLRDRLLADIFGASGILDAYFAAFKIPDLLFNILVLGAVTSAFIPIFQKVWEMDKAEARQLASTVLNILLLTIALITIIFYFTTPRITVMLVPGFSDTQIQLTIELTRIILLSLLFFTFSNVLSGILNAWKRFFSFALSAVLYNLGILFGIIVLAPRYGITAIAYGVVIGSFLHFFAQLIEAHMAGWRYQPIIVMTTHVRKLFVLMLPRTIGLTANQLNIIVITYLASQLPVGSLSVFNFANNLQSFPVSIFGISLAVSAFPSFSQALSRNDHDNFRRIFSLQFRRVMFFLIPLSIFILLLRAQIVRVVLGSGLFDWTATYLTAQVLGYFAISLFAQGLIPLLARSFYALEDTKTPVFISIIAMIINIFTGIFLARYFGIIGLAAAFSISSIIQFAMLYFLLRKRLRDLDDMVIIASIRRILLLTMVSAAILYLSLQLFANYLNTQTFLGIFFQGLISGILGIATYVLLSFLLKLDEVNVIRRYTKNFIAPLYKNKFRK